MYVYVVWGLIHHIRFNEYHFVCGACIVMRGTKQFTNIQYMLRYDYYERTDRPTDEHTAHSTHDLCMYVFVYADRGTEQSIVNYYLYVFSRL